MYRNYKCQLDFNLPGVSEETLFFLRQLLAKDPENRPSAEQALEDECFLHLEMDEQNSKIHMLSRKLKMPLTL